MKYEKNKSTLFWVILIELEKVHYFFKANILSSISYIILLNFPDRKKKKKKKRILLKFLKTGVPRKCTLLFSRAKFTKLLYLKFMLI